jgi:hypothetical protein
MNRQAIQIFVAFAILVGISATMLARARSNYSLGQPGVKVADVPMYAVFEGGLTNAISPISVPLPERALEFRSVPLTVDPTELQMLPPDTVYGRRNYIAADGFRTMISVVLMGTDRTSIHKPQYCLQGQGQSIIKTEHVSVPMKRPHPYDLQVVKLTTASEVRSGGQVIPLRGLFVYWFVADGHLTPHHGERMWLMAKELITNGELQRWAYVAYWAMCYPGQEDATFERMKALIVETVPQFQTTAGPETTRSVAANLPLVEN